MLIFACCVYMLMLTFAICNAADSPSSKIGPIDFGLPGESYKDLLKNRDGKKPKLVKLSYWNCGSSEDKGRLLDLQLSNTNTGDVIVTASGKTDIDLTSPVQVTFDLRKYVLGVWVRVPCYKDLGSCDHQDFCKFGSKSCPLPFLLEQNVPCRCPIEKGTYTISRGLFKVPRLKTASILTGSYKGKVEIFVGEDRLACYNGTFTLDVSPY